MRNDLDDSKDEIITLLSQGTSQSEICAIFRCKPDTLKRRLRIWGYEHLKNQGAKGRPRFGARKSVISSLQQNTVFTTSQLKKRLWREWLKPQYCEECGWAVMADDGRLPLELHHVNGDRFDNRLDNLLVLCPNCHALKPTNSGRNVGRYVTR